MLVLYSGSFLECLPNPTACLKFVLTKDLCLFRNDGIWIQISTPSSFLFYDECKSQLLSIKDGKRKVVQSDSIQDKDLLLDCSERRFYELKDDEICPVLDLDQHIKIKVQQVTTTDTTLFLDSIGSNIEICPDSEIQAVTINGSLLIVDLTSFEGSGVLKYETTVKESKKCKSKIFKRVIVIVIIIRCPPVDETVAFSLTSGDVSDGFVTIPSLTAALSAIIDGPPRPVPFNSFPLVSWDVSYSEGCSSNGPAGIVIVTNPGIHSIRSQLSYEIQPSALAASQAGILVGAISVTGFTIVDNGTTYTLTAVPGTIFGVIVGNLVIGFFTAGATQSPGGMSDVLQGFFCGTVDPPPDTLTPIMMFPLPFAVGTYTTTVTGSFSGFFGLTPVLNASASIMVTNAIVFALVIPPAIPIADVAPLVALLAILSLPTLRTYVPYFALVLNDSTVLYESPIDADRLNFLDLDDLTTLLNSIFIVPVIPMGFAFELPADCANGLEFYNIIDVAQISLNADVRLMVSDRLRIYYVNGVDSGIAITAPVPLDLLEKGTTFAGNRL